MVVENDIPSFLSWLPGAILVFFAMVVLLTLVGVVFSYVLSTFRHGPFEAFYIVAGVLGTAATDLVHTSPRRLWALARLSIQESIHRRVLVAFGIFVLVLLFAGWYLDVKSDQPGRLYLSFVLTATNYLILILALFLSTFSLPNDIKYRTIYTVTTKPVRPGEIVLGRILGFAAIGTLLLAIMCLISYVFVVRGLNHDHTIDDQQEVSPRSAGELAAQPSDAKQFETKFNRAYHHRHTVTVTADGKAYTDEQMGHTHPVTVTGEGDRATYEIGPPQGMLLARVPVYGKLRFIDRTGRPGSGINVGSEWTYRSYIEGESLAAAVWTFDGVTEKRFPNGLPLELTLSVFRTHKGQIEERVAGEIWLKNPNPAKPIESERRPFISKEYSAQQIFLPRQLDRVDEQGNLRKIDLFKDLADDGKVELWIACAERGQYFGMAQADVYLRAADNSFFLNLCKGYVSIWLQMIIVTCFGVVFSTFLSGAVAMISTVSSVVLGFFTGFIVNVFRGVVKGFVQRNQLIPEWVPLINHADVNRFVEYSFRRLTEAGEVVVGGGPIESIYRLVTQASVGTELDTGFGVTQFIVWTDFVLMFAMWIVTLLLPDFRAFDTVNYVAYGYDISASLLAQRCAATLAFALVLAVFGYFFLKTRELAA